jgi:hypothetical protein
MYRISVNVQADQQELLSLTTEEIDEIQSRPQPAPAPNYLAFWDALVTSTIYSSIREQSPTSLPINTLVTEFIALMGDAKAGRPNEAFIQQSIGAITTAGIFTEIHLNELQAALEIGNLDNIFAIPEL